MSSEPIIAPGDIVSQPDGPPMTVERVVGDIIHCVWFVGDRLFRDVLRKDRVNVR
jgi:hypothetical protein